MFFRLSLVLLLVVTTASAQGFRHRSPSVDVAVSPDQSLVAVVRSGIGTSKNYGRVELWDTETGELQRTITGFDGPIWSLTFSKDGRSLITVSSEFRESSIQASIKERREKVFAELKWWDVQSGDFIRKLPLAEEGITSLEAAWSPGGDVFALVERYTKSQFTSRQVPTFGNQMITPPVFDAVESVNLKLLDAQTGERKAKVEDVDKTFYGRLILLFGRVDEPVFSPDGATLAAIYGENVVLWSVANGRKVRTLKKLKGFASSIAFSPDSRMIAISSIKGPMPGGESEVSVWDVATGNNLHRLKGRNDAIACIQFVVRGQAILMGSLEYKRNIEMGTVKLWDLRDNRVKSADIYEGKTVSSFTLIHNQQQVVLQSGEAVEVRDARTWRVIHSFESSEDEKSESIRRSRYILSANRAVAVAFSRDGTTVSAEIPGEGIRRWDARTGGVRARIPHAQSSDNAVLALSSDGDFVVETTAEGVRLRDFLNGTTKQIPLDTDDPISAMTLAPDNRTLITADESGLVHVWDTETGQSKKTIQVGQQITAVAIDNSGQLLATARADRSIVLWDLKTGAVRSEFRKHENVVNALAFSPDGTILASGGDDRTAILWELASGKAKRTLKGHDMTVTSLAFSPDSLTLASGSGNTSVVLWNVTNGKLDRILR
ncbi:MAG TPA: WD40 repeat domain-containing protein [Pyrinomonadaceae bacterium]|nr:WD40 repeat domain-containing protein [Pyrinomonadaceae bacterium]